MAIVIPDLFGAFQKGREYAIDRNWKDLENYETIEKMRTANDLSQLALLQERYYTPLKMNMFANNADNSEMQSQIQFTAFPGALSNARQFTNQAISNEGVQGATINDTALTNISAITGRNAMTKAQGAIDLTQANNTDTKSVGKARADVVNEKARNALANIKIEQDIFKRSSEEKRIALENAIANLQNIQELQPLLNQVNNLKTVGDYNNGLALVIRAKGEYERSKIQANEGGYASVGVSGNGNGTTNPNIDLTKRSDEQVASYAQGARITLNDPNSSPEQKLVANKIIEDVGIELARRGYPTEQNTVERGSISPITNTTDNRLPMFRDAVPLATQQEANQPQDLTGGGQPQQTQATSLVKSIEDNSNLAPAVKNVRKNYAILDESGGPGLFGETDINPSTPLIRIGNRQVGVSLQTLKALNDVKEIENLTPNQLLLYNSLLLNPKIKKIPVKDKNGNERLKFDPVNQPSLIPFTTTIPSGYYDSYSWSR